MTYRTCTGCAFGEGYCHERERVRRQVSGLGVTSLKWRCAWKRLKFRPGDQVWATTVCEWGSSEEEGPITADYPATVIQNFGSKLLVFIEPGAFESGLEEGDYPFEPKSGGTGFCKITLSRIRRREGTRENVCHYCRKIIGRQGHDEYCSSVRQSWQPATARLAPPRSAEA